ncbi:MAG: RNA-binding S4 domain-containing protein [Pseudomonadota bacterium]
MQKLEFTLNGEFVELNQLLKLVGVCDSGGAGKMLVASGAVKVDGQTELRKTAKIRAGQVVGLGDIRITIVAESA